MSTFVRPSQLSANAANVRFVRISDVGAACSERPLSARRAELGCLLWADTGHTDASLERQLCPQSTNFQNPNVLQSNQWLVGAQINECCVMQERLLKPLGPRAPFNDGDAYTSCADMIELAPISTGHLGLTRKA